MPIAPAVLRGFTRAVADALDDGVLRFDRRQQLVARAGRLGIRRFDATLIIAAVQYRHERRPERVGWLPPGGPGGARRLRVAQAAFFLAVQSAIIAGIWYTIHG